MAKAKEDKKSKYASMVRKAAQGFSAKPGSQIYREYKDYNPKDVDQRESITHRGSPVLRSSKTADQWATELNVRGGKSVGDIFRKDGKIYKITSGARGSVTATEVKI
jgi:hypothetical protein